MSNSPRSDTGASTDDAGRRYGEEEKGRRWKKKVSDSRILENCARHKRRANRSVLDNSMTDASDRGVVEGAFVLPSSIELSYS